MCRNPNSPLRFPRLPWGNFIFILGKLHLHLEEAMGTRAAMGKFHLHLQFPSHLFSNSHIGSHAATRGVKGFGSELAESCAVGRL
ncbi:unnamed protein product [Rhodiola kirilowii]